MGENAEVALDRNCWPERNQRFPASHRKGRPVELAVLFVK
jgi:hypothetical protein